MMKMMLYNAKVLTPTEVIEEAAVVVSEEGRLAYVGPMNDAPRVLGRRMDVQGRIVVPGFVDVHVHGGQGITFESSDKIAEDLQAYSEWVTSRGVTGFLCTIAAPTANLLAQKVSAFKLFLTRSTNAASGPR
jgi:N-acetylglucosamine-6-phosphate deacetylase